jgi:probable F420-dependent oxidoreductase
VRLDVVLPNEGAYCEAAIRAAPFFEDLGFEGLWLTDHVVGMEGYRPVYGDIWLEILTTLGYLAASTKKIRLGTGVLVVPYRDAILQAKMLATIDVLSGGRLDVGVGTGWARREFQALGRAEFFEPRGAVVDDALTTWKVCWQGGEFTHDSQFSKASKIRFAPTPVQKPGPPIWIGARGLAPAPLRRAARFADVWHPSGVSPEEMKEGGDKLDAMAGRKVPRSIRTQLADPSTMHDMLRRYEEAGCIQAAIDFKADSLDELKRRAEALMKAKV